MMDAWLVRWTFPGEDWWFPEMGFKGLWANDGSDLRCVILAKDRAEARELVRKAHYHDNEGHGQPEELSGVEVSRYTKDPYKDPVFKDVVAKGAVWNSYWWCSDQNSNEEKG